MDESVIISHRTLCRVSLAVLLIDELTGAAITGSNARAWIENEKPPIKKGDGWFVFTDLLPGDYTVLAEGGHYLRQTVDCTAQAETMQTVRLLLKPARTYPAGVGCLRIEGRAEPGAEITVWLVDKQNVFKLLADASSGTDSLTVYHSDGVSLEGCILRLISPDGTEENAAVREKTGENTYRLRSPLANGYPRIGTKLIPASVTRADEKGGFFIALKSGSAKAKIICEANGSSQVRREYDGADGHSLAPDLRV